MELKVEDKIVYGGLSVDEINEMDRAAIEIVIKKRSMMSTELTRVMTRAMDGCISTEDFTRSLNGIFASLVFSALLHYRKRSKEQIDEIVDFLEKKGRSAK